MQIISQPVTNILRNLHRKQTIASESLEAFQRNLIGFLDKIKNPNRESYQENDLRDFLNESFYKGKFYFNKKDNIDFVIHNGNEKSKVGVIIEVKKSSEKNDMVSENNPNVKSLHQLMLYYLEERINHHNHEIKHLIVTNCHEWYIFNELWFNENIFTTKFKKTYQDWKLSGHGTDDFYKFHAKKYLENLEKPIEFYKIDLRDYAQAKPQKLEELYKILSPEHLLKQEIANDANKLNKPFYNELLYILGIEDRKASDSNKRIIDRIEEKNRQDGSLIENAINKLKLKDCLSKIPNLDAFGDTYPEQLYSVALELCITWLNRILFLKLLEAQLVKYHSGDKSYRFLNYQKITDFDELAELFFEVLAIPTAERSESVNKKYGNIPYLNSSLFELSELEKATISIEDLKDRLEVKIADSTVLVSDTGKPMKGQMNTLKYLFGFLDAYNFGSDPDIHGVTQSNAMNGISHQKLINAAVLGLIFEKLNGYKDGSFYTPAFITMYMCRETIRRAVVQKFNTSLGWNCVDFNNLKDRIGQYVKKEERKSYNQLINSIRICDPAVGSGHFLVSALNEMIVIKAELNILQHPDGRSLTGLNITIENDELIIFDEKEGKDFEYVVGTKGNLITEKQLIQETLFEEKRTIIENCLFGVDINPKSVKICQLRLWIELLKNAYYLSGGEKEKGEKETVHHSPVSFTPSLETLPNIDINIKTGNSLVSKYALDQDLSEVFLKQKFSLQTYQNAVYAYKETRSKTAKTELKAFIDEIKEQFKQNVANFDPKRKRLKELLGKRLLLENNIDLFGNKSMDEDQLDLQKRKLDKQITDLETEINDVTNSKIYRNSFEWRFEFPEVLDEKGNFVGFDVVIGNPPYISLSKDLNLTKYKQTYKTFEQSGDIYALFYEFGNTILKNYGLLNFITGSAWLRANYGKNLRTFFLSKCNLINLIDCSDCKVFDEATVLTSIVLYEKSLSQNSIKAIRLGSELQEKLSELEEYFGENSITLENLSDSAWSIASNVKRSIIQKVIKQGVKLKELNCKINYGVKTGFNEAFIIDAKVREDLILKDSRNNEIIKPVLRGRDMNKFVPSFANIYLINTHNGNVVSIQNPQNDIIKKEIGYSVKVGGIWQDINNIEVVKGKQYRINRIIAEIEYPEIYSYLKQFESELKKRTDKGEHWTNLRNCTYLDEFKNDKIIYSEITKFLPFTFDSYGYFIDKTAFMLSCQNLKYTCCYLNSILFKYCFEDNFSEIQGHSRVLSKSIFEEIKIKPIDKLKELPFIERVDKILALKSQDPKADTSILEDEIDEMVFDLYELTEEERQVVKGV